MSWVTRVKAYKDPSPTLTFPFWQHKRDPKHLFDTLFKGSTRAEHINQFLLFSLQEDKVRLGERSFSAHVSQIFKMAHKKRASIFLTLPLTSHLMLSLPGLVQFCRNSDYMRQNSMTYKERTSMIRDMKSFHSCLFSVPIPYISPAILYLIQHLEKGFLTKLTLEAVMEQIGTMFTISFFHPPFD